MAKKISRSKTAKKTTVKKTTVKKTTNNEDTSSLGVLLLAVAGIVLLVWFGSTGMSKDDTNTSDTKTETTIEKPIKKLTICNKTYASEEAAYDAIKRMPQVQLCDEGVSFRSSYVEEK